MLSELPHAKTQNVDAFSSDIARSMVAKYAMEPKLDHVAFDNDRGSFLGPAGAVYPFQRQYGDDTTAREIDCAVRKNVLTAFERAVQILQDNRELLEGSSQMLLERETLDDADLTRLFADVNPATEDFLATSVPCKPSGSDQPAVEGQRDV